MGITDKQSPHKLKKNWTDWTAGVLRSKAGFTQTKPPVFIGKKSYREKNA